MVLYIYYVTGFLRKHILHTICVQQTLDAEKLLLQWKIITQKEPCFLSNGSNYIGHNTEAGSQGKERC